MTDLVAPQAKRLRTPSWRDTRLLLGVLLVLVATAGGGWIVARADRTMPVYAANGPLVPGQALRAQDLRRVDVRLGDGAAEYLSAGRPLAPDAHALRSIAEGELIPAAAVGGAQSVTTRVVAVPIDATSASLLAPGVGVDVFVSRPTGASAGAKVVYADPELLLPAVTVVAVPDVGSMLGGSAARRSVHLAIPADKVKALVADLDVDSRVTVVPVPGATGSDGSATGGRTPGGSG